MYNKGVNIRRKEMSDTKNAVEKGIDTIKKVATDVSEATKDVDETIKGAVVGGVVGYVASEDNKERNTIFGAVAGYLFGRHIKNKKKDF